MKNFTLQYRPKESRFAVGLVLIGGLIFSVLSPAIFGLTNSTFGIFLAFGLLVFFGWHLPQRFANEIEITFGGEGLNVRILKKGWLSPITFEGHKSYLEITKIRQWHNTSRRGGFSVLNITFSDGTRLELQTNSVIKNEPNMSLKAIGEQLIIEIKSRDLDVSLEGEGPYYRSKNTKIGALILAVLILILGSIITWILIKKWSTISTEQMVYLIIGSIAEGIFLVSFVRIFIKHNKKPNS